MRYFLSWYDDVPRDEMRRQMLTEVNRELGRRFDFDAVAPRRKKAEFVAA
jgi:hypothetical protein